MPLRDWFRPPRHLLALFAVVTVVPALALGWLAWRSLGQDAELDRQRVKDTLETALGKVVAELQRRLDDVSHQVPALARAEPAQLPDDSVLLVVADDGVTERPAGRLLYYPRLPAGSRQRQPMRTGAQDAALEAAVALEVRARDATAAAEAFGRLADSPDPAAQATALLGLARCLRRAGRPQEALLAYDRLARLGTLDVEGAPAELVARRARCAVLADVKSPELQVAARDLYQDLLRPRWILDRATFEYYAGEARAWLPAGSDPEPDAVRLALADAAADVDTLRRQQGSLPGRGRTTVWRRDRPLLITWANEAREMTALAVGASWFERPAATWAADNLAVTLTDTESHVVFGAPGRLSKPLVVASAADTSLPWTVRVASADPSKVPSVLARNRRMLVGALGVVGLLIGVGGFLVARALARELAVARLQSDFVAAVSHEFRSPLTAMKHLVEMLDQGAVPSEDRRRQYYRVLSGETNRLQQMVENLLNFGRMEAGKAEYRFEHVDIRALVEQVVGAFGDGTNARERLTMSVTGPPVRVSADREALSRAMWNLLDNAVKYSPDTAPLQVALDASTDTASISVRDRGPGIPRAERKQIFAKFYRGAEAKTSGVKGTGLGLATVQHIVRAHRGHVVVDSTPGEGSTFTIVLPVEKEETS